MSVGLGQRKRHKKKSQSKLEGRNIQVLIWRKSLSSVQHLAQELSIINCEHSIPAEAIGCERANVREVAATNFRIRDRFGGGEGVVFCCGPVAFCVL
jgi:hypothetical protein